MTSLAMAPFNLDLLILSTESVKNMRPVTALDIFEGSNRNFHPNGLFSIETFGRVGEERRNRLFSYIDLKVSVLHPLVFKMICNLKHLYGGIMAGTDYATWDETTKDFTKAPPTSGFTGYAFFMSHFSELTFEERASDRREFSIKLVNKYRDNCLLSRLIVMPAGLRDYEVDENNKPSEDEINLLYRKALSLSNIIDPSILKLNADDVDLTRYSIQLTVLELYEYIENMLEGKKKLILGKWASRKIFNGTRNVITSMNNDTDELGSALTVGFNQTVVGLYQYLKASLPISIYNIRNTHLQKVFQGPNMPVVLVNTKTLRKELVHLDPDFYDQWMTDEGLENTINKFGEESLRHLPVKINGYYIGLMYNGPDGTFKFMQDISELPSGFKKECVAPITFAELLYISVYHKSEEMPCFVTRYPITGYGSIYPGYVCLKTTVNSLVKTELDDNWEITDRVANQYPILGESFINSLSPHPSHVGRMGADFDR